MHSELTYKMALAARGLDDYENISHAAEVRSPADEHTRFLDHGEGDEMLDLIFAYNPRTGKPTNDISLLVNNNTAPEIRRYIDEQLRKDMRVSAPLEVDADMAAELARRSGESAKDYIERMSNVVRSEHFAQLQRDAIEVASRNAASPSEPSSSVDE